LSIITKSKHPKRGGYKEQNGRTHIQEDKRTTKSGKPLAKHQVPEPPVVTSISNKERRGTGKTSSDISVSREHLGECKIMLGFLKLE
jgi:hypothetical protein